VYCKRCHPGAIQPRWNRQRVLRAMREWRDRYGRLPSSYDWSRTHARRRGGDALARLAQESGHRRAWLAPCSEPGPPPARRRFGARRRLHRDRLAAIQPAGLRSDLAQRYRRRAMLPLGFRFDVDAVILDATAHQLTSHCGHPFSRRVRRGCLQATSTERSAVRESAPARCRSGCSSVTRSGLPPVCRFVSGDDADRLAT
jgi:hypothetical protein